LPQHLLEQDAFVSGVLVDDDQPFVAFGKHIEVTDAAEEAKGSGRRNRN
jgi:hypothetical protein